MNKKSPTSEYLTNLPKNETVSVSIDLDSKHPFVFHDYEPGNSVNEHKNLEEANLFLNEGEVGQQRENN